MPLVTSSNTLVISSHPPRWAELAKYTCTSQKRWCERQGYDYHVDVSDVQDRTHEGKWVPIAGFIKIDLFLRFFDDYERIIWLDADLLVTNVELPPPAHYGIHEINLPYDYNGHNATVIDVLTTAEMRAFLWAVNNTGRRFFLDHPWKEMEAMRYFLQTPPHQFSVDYVSAKRLCALLTNEYEPYVPHEVSAPYQWEPGDFALHLSALPLDRRVELARYYSEALALQ